MALKGEEEEFRKELGVEVVVVEEVLVMNVVGVVWGVLERVGAVEEVLVKLEEEEGVVELE